MKRSIGVVVVLVALTLGAIAVMSVVVSQNPGRKPTITDAQGAVGVQRGGGRSVAAGAGQTLDVQDVITTGHDGRAEIAFGPDNRIRLSPDTTAVVRSVDDGLSLELEGGALQATVRPGGGVLRVGNGGREIQASDAEFEVALGPDDLFVTEVERGEVRTTGVDGLAAIEAGQRASIPSSGRAVLQPISEQLLLSVQWPDQKTRAPSTLIRGTTAPGSRVRIDGGLAQVDVLADREGVFVAEIRLADGKKPLEVHATDPLGKVAKVDGFVIERDTHGPTLKGETNYSGQKP